MISNEHKNILLVHLYSNGDCLYATTVAKQIKNDFPNCKLTWAIADFCQGIIDNNPCVDEKLVITSVKKDDVVAFRKLKKQFYQQKKSGIWDEVFITMNMDENLALYDGTIRGMVLRAYPNPITVPVQPVLILTEAEKANATAFAAEHNLSSFENVILWEYAPQSGQAAFNAAKVLNIAKQIVELPSTCIILSSLKSFATSSKIFDASKLSFRENAALTHFCTLLIGSSSGITWLSTSSAGKFLPMVQLLQSNGAFLNAPSVDFARFGLPADKLIELIDADAEELLNCVEAIADRGFEKAKSEYHTSLPLQFNTTPKIIYNLMCYLHFKAVLRHYRINSRVYGSPSLFKRKFFKGIFTFPAKLLKNLFTKRILMVGN
ncbi:MAG: hypothetical protein ABIO05_06195 [Ferruginibacter sp.]